MKKKLLLLLLIIMVFVSGCSVKKVEEMSPSEKFSKEYSVPKENAFKYVSIDEVLEILRGGTGIIFFGNSDNEVSTKTVKVFSEAIKDSGFDEVTVYYYNPVVIRDNNTSKYIELISLLSGYLDVNDNDEEYLYLPDIYFVKDGKIVSHNNDMATNSTDDILGDEDDSKIKDKYIKLLNEYFEKDTSE